MLHSSALLYPFFYVETVNYLLTVLNCGLPIIFICLLLVSVIVVLSKKLYFNRFSSYLSRQLTFNEEYNNGFHTWLFCLFGLIVKSYTCCVLAHCVILTLIQSPSPIGVSFSHPFLVIPTVAVLLGAVFFTVDHFDLRSKRNLEAAARCLCLVHFVAFAFLSVFVYFREKPQTHNPIFDFKVSSLFSCCWRLGVLFFSSDEWRHLIGNSIFLVCAVAVSATFQSLLGACREGSLVFLSLHGWNASYVSLSIAHSCLSLLLLFREVIGLFEEFLKCQSAGLIPKHEMSIKDEQLQQKTQEAHSIQELSKMRRLRRATATAEHKIRRVFLASHLGVALALCNPHKLSGCVSEVIFAGVAIRLKLLVSLQLSQCKKQVSSALAAAFRLQDFELNERVSEVLGQFEYYVDLYTFGCFIAMFLGQDHVLAVHDAKTEGLATISDWVVYLSVTSTSLGIFVGIPLLFLGRLCNRIPAIRPPTFYLVTCLVVSATVTKGGWHSVGVHLLELLGLWNIYTRNIFSYGESKILQERQE